MQQQSITTVQIFGKEYPIASDQNPEYIRKLAEFVDKEMGKIAERTQTAPPNRVAVLACLNIADDLIRVRSEKEKFIRLVEGRIKNIKKTLEKKLGI